MSICTSVDSLKFSVREKIAQELNIRLEETYVANPRVFYIQPFRVDNDTLYLPYAYAKSKIGLKPKPRSAYPSIVASFEGTLREEQKIVKNEVILELNRSGSCILSTYTGMGKTVLGIYLASKIKLKTLIIVNRLVLIDQWKKAIRTFCPMLTVETITPKKPIKPADFYLINGINVSKLGCEAFREIGLLILDEAHLLLAELISQALQYITPRYLLGLSATPYRPDGMDILFELYFGSARVTRELRHHHTVYLVETGYKPPVQRTRIGRLDWNAILEFQAVHGPRNDLILSLIRQHSSRVFLVLCKRKAQATHLMSRLEDEGESVTSLIGDQRNYDGEARILIATVQKAGVGFNHPRLDSLIVATDMEAYFLQYLGRVFRTEEVSPIIFDLVDDNPTLKKHYRTREAEYRKAGGEIRTWGGIKQRRLLKPN